MLFYVNTSDYKFLCILLTMIMFRLKVKGRFMGPFNTAAIGLLYSYPNKFPHSSPEAPRTKQMRGTSTSEGGNYYQ
jgi:hypothetical protein